MRFRLIAAIAAIVSEWVIIFMLTEINREQQHKLDDIFIHMDILSVKYTPSPGPHYEDFFSLLSPDSFLVSTSR